MVLVGAEAVMENGGIVNKLGTYQIAVCAKACDKPLYVAAESYKFARLYPLTQKVDVVSSPAIPRFARYMTRLSSLPHAHAHVPYDAPCLTRMHTYHMSI